jgi:hypothetical protein
LKPPPAGRLRRARPSSPTQHRIKKLSLHQAPLPVRGTPPAALAVRVAGSVRVVLGPDGVGASVTRPAPSQAGPALSTPGPPGGGGPRER